MRRGMIWLPLGLLAALSLTLWGVWTYRLHQHDRDLAHALEAERQRAFVDLAYHVEQLQALLGKGLATGSSTQNMRYMADVNRHATAAASAFGTLPLPAELSAGTGKFIQQVGDFSLSLLRNEASGRSMGQREREELRRLRQDSASLSQQITQVMTQYTEGGFRWHPPARLSWSGLVRGPIGPGRPAVQEQAAALMPEGWDQVGPAVEKMPVFIYDGPFSDHVNHVAPALTGPPMTQEEASQLLPKYLPGFDRYRSVGVTEVGGSLPAYTYQLTSSSAQPAYVTVDITRHGGQLLQLLNGRMVGPAILGLDQARTIGQQYLTAIGLGQMVPTYGQVEDGTATIAFAHQKDGVLIYPDQAKVKIALDDGEILAVDTRPYLMHHKDRPLPAPRLTPEQAQAKLGPDLAVQRVRLSLIPDLAGTGELLTYEFLTKLADQTYLVYINSQTGAEEQILQLIETDGGTFTL